MSIPPNLIWALRALCQYAQTQASLYPSFVHVPDELVEDFGEAFDALEEATKNRWPKLFELDSAIMNKSGQLEFWTTVALSKHRFWDDLRVLSRSTLLEMGETTLCPNPSAKIFVSRDG